MPRYRTITCDHCGHLVRKRDTECEVCGRMTRRERNLWLAKAMQIGLALIVGAVVYIKIKNGLFLAQ